MKPTDLIGRADHSLNSAKMHLFNFKPSWIPTETFGTKIKDLASIASVIKLLIRGELNTGLNNEKKSEK